MTEGPFIPSRVLVLRKFSRLEYERLCSPGLSEEQLAAILNKRGSIYESLKHYDHIQRSCLQQIESVLAENNIEFITVDRFGYTDDKIEWADVIVTSGGDGTFLMAASKVSSRDKPVIGVNSDPSKSIGHLCLPSYYSDKFAKVLEHLREGKFQWQYKQRLRVTLTGEAAEEQPRELNDIRYDIRLNNQMLDQDDGQDQRPVDYRWPIVLPSGKMSNSLRGTPKTTRKISTSRRQLKERALNEVFVGETLSARVSYYELAVDNNQLTKMKSSGLTVCTGTGSTSWYFNINKMTENQIQSIATIINKVTKREAVPTGDSKLISEIAKQFNDTLTFPASEPTMAYSVRDPVKFESTIAHNHRGYAKKIEVKSRMQNACLVLDGCQFYPFNDGSNALIEIYDEDALKTLSMDACCPVEH